MSLLISHGATVDVFSGDGITPLHDAVMYGSKEQVATLVRAGADTELADKSGKNACTLAEETETQGRKKTPEEQEDKAEEEDSSSVRTSPREKRPSVLPEDFIDPEQIHIEDMGCENMPTKNKSNVAAADETCDDNENGAEENVETDKNSVINEA